MERQNNWYVVYTKPRWEKKVASMLSDRNVTNYCPLNREVHQWHDRKKTVLEPLFKSYVFIWTHSEEFRKIKEVSGILNFVYWLGKPAVVRNEEIENIQRFMNEYSDVKVEQTRVNLHDRVRVVQGPFLNMEGNVVEVNSRTVKLELPSLGFALMAQVEKAHVERVVVMNAPHVHTKVSYGF